MNPTIHDLEEMARKAGVIILTGFGRRPGFDHNQQASHKGVIDLVTEMDHRSESYFLGEIQRRFPGHSVMTEESRGLEGEEEARWLIDPLDGTVNYVHGIPIFTVSLAFTTKGVVRLGVVYDPTRDECFSAELGQGAVLNGERIKASSARTLDDCLLVTGFPYDIRANPENNLDHFARFSLLSQGVRRLGSAALDLCYVAAGRFDGFWEIRLNPWDVAAGGLIAAESGAVVTDVRGGPDYLSPPQSILAANPHIHPLMLEVLNEP